MAIKFEIVKSKKKQGINLPKRSTAKSAGYDFEASENVVIMPGKIGLVPTGIKALFPEEVVLCLYDRSSNPRKKGIALANSVGIIDSDYYGNESNDGEIMGQFTNLTNEPVTIQKGDRIFQGIFMPFLLASDDQATGERTGGFGSTK